MTERVLLAGCGDLGLRVAARLQDRGHEVWALRRSPREDLSEGIRWLRGDLTAPSTLAGLPVGFTQVVYSPTPGAREEAAYRAVFVDGLRHLVEAVATKDVKRWLFVSSSAVYGEHGDAWVDETTPTDPPGFNGRILREAEQWLALQGLPAVSMRLAGIYGAGRTQLLDRIRAGVARVPRGSPHWSNRIHADDAAAAIAHVLSLPEVDPLYLGVDDTPLPMDVLYDALADLMHVPRPAEGPAPAGIGSKKLSNARLKATGFRCQWPDAREGYRALV
ncbi:MULTISPECIES: NAD-dependent epimerase/dehydratase family protein [Dyella]|uniref:NAD-dependent epimerase/dehydratase family protein n=2 Tax=Dyella TaxID=231454 RepID=A0A4R0YUR6_9GAMM|nr:MULTISPECIES: NAD-dependent epimerase/dehydratase family protein [Dyella]TBR40207.1 NAD-dependent epimerase/dehydratase family protein [Dyella terrae]TCI12211.1 NAD-dependent epimerase/dehydratase family protein [Dyella soli]